MAAAAAAHAAAASAAAAYAASHMPLQQPQQQQRDLPNFDQRQQVQQPFASTAAAAATAGAGAGKNAFAVPNAAVRAACAKSPAASVASAAAAAAHGARSMPWQQSQQQQHRLPEHDQRQQQAQQQPAAFRATKRTHIADQHAADLQVQLDPTTAAAVAGGDAFGVADTACMVAGSQPMAGAAAAAAVAYAARHMPSQHQQHCLPEQPPGKRARCVSQPGGQVQSSTTAAAGAGGDAPVGAHCSDMNEVDVDSVEAGTLNGGKQRQRRGVDLRFAAAASDNGSGQDESGDVSDGSASQRTSSSCENRRSSSDNSGSGSGGDTEAVSSSSCDEAVHGTKPRRRRRAQRATRRNSSRGMEGGHGAAMDGAAEPAGTKPRRRRGAPRAKRSRGTEGADGAAADGAAEPAGTSGMEDAPPTDAMVQDVMRKEGVEPKFQARVAAFTKNKYASTRR